MPNVSIIHIDEDLCNLFAKEQEVIERITSFCNRTDKEIECLYSLSVFNTWKLEIKTISDEGEK